jgi:hypothetical protein
MRKLLAILVILVTFSASKARADEGMWLLPLIEKLNIGTMTEMGLKLTAEDIYSINQASLKDAIVIFGGGCTVRLFHPRVSFLQTTTAVTARSRTTAPWSMITLTTVSGQCQRKRSFPILDCQ